MPIDNHRRLRDAVKRKRPLNWVTTSWFLHHEYVATHRSVLVKDFLETHNVATPEHPSNFPDLFEGDFYMLSLLKSAFEEAVLLCCY